MIGAGEGFWFSFREQPGRITYTFHLLGDEIEVGEASSVSEMCNRFDALVARHRGQIN